MFVMKSFIYIICGLFLFVTGLVNEGLWPWLLVCMVGGGMIGHGLALLSQGE